MLLIVSLMTIIQSEDISTGMKPLFTKESKTDVDDPNSDSMTAPITARRRGKANQVKPLKVCKMESTL